MADPIERVRLTHLQIPLKEPFRISGGEVADQGCDPRHRRDRQRRVGIGESSPMAAGFGYSADTPEGCWDDLAERIAPSLLGRPFESVEEIAALAAAWTRQPVRHGRGRDRLLGPARPGATTRPRRAARRLDDQIEPGVESGLAVGLYPTIVELLKAIETHLAEGYRRVKIKIRPGPATSSSSTPSASTSATSR